MMPHAEKDPLSPTDTHKAIASRWGEDIARATGTLHVTAVGRDAGGTSVVLRISPRSPKSATDLWALGIARARADVIITTGSILRAEPTLCHDPDPALLGWRTEILRKPTSAALAILTRGTDLPLDHPALQERKVLLATSPQGAEHLTHKRLPRGMDIVALPSASLRGLIAELRRRGEKTICIEAGPSTATALYQDPCAIDELMLSTFEETIVPGGLAAGPFIDTATLRHRLGEPLRHFTLREQSGTWSFSRFRAISPKPRN